MKKFKGIVVFMLLGLLMTIPMSAMASNQVEMDNLQETSTIMPRWTYISSTETDLTIKNTTATVDCWVKGNILSATKTKVIAELQVKNSATNWIPVSIWTDTQDAFKSSVYETKNVTAGNTYRVKATYTVWEGTQSETVTIFSDEVTA